MKFDRKKIAFIVLILFISILFISGTPKFVYDTSRTLYDKINNLNTLLPQNIEESLHHYRFIGNEAVHQLTAPSMDELRSTIEVMEDLLNFIYDLDYKAANLSLKVGAVSSGQQEIQPDVEAVKRVLERSPQLSPRLQTLFQILYQKGDQGLAYEELVAMMRLTMRQVNGVLGALGRRINNTTGVEGNPGIPYLFEIVYVIDGDPDTWGWRMRKELKKVIKNGNYSWAKDWI